MNIKLISAVVILHLPFYDIFDDNAIDKFDFNGAKMAYQNPWNTGAYYVCSMLFLKRIKGIEKSCLMATIPTLNDKGVCMLDVGANAENTVDQRCV